MHELMREGSPGMVQMHELMRTGSDMHIMPSKVTPPVILQRRQPAARTPLRRN